MATFAFGSGTAWFVRTDLATPTPRYFAAMQNIEVSFESTVQRAFGQYQMPLDVARGQMKVTGKASSVAVQGQAMADLFFNETVLTGQTTTANQEAGTVPASPVYTIAVTNAATFVADLGVLYGATGVPLTAVATAGAVATGKYYASSNGTYTFAAGDAGLAMKLSYRYTVAGSGQYFVINNQAMGNSPQFSMTLEQIGKTKKAVLILNAVIATKLTDPTKLDNYTIQEMDFEGFADASQVIGKWSFNEIN